MGTAKRVGLYRNYRFIVEIDGITHAGFADWPAFDSNTVQLENREEDENATVRKLQPGFNKHGNILLKWGFTDSRRLYDWYREIMNGKIARKNGSIVVVDTEGKEEVRWNFFRGGRQSGTGPISAQRTKTWRSRHWRSHTQA